MHNCFSNRNNWVIDNLTVVWILWDPCKVDCSKAVDWWQWSIDLQAKSQSRNIKITCCICWPFAPVLRILPCDATCKRGLCCRPLSVCLSITLVYCIHTAEDIVKLLFFLPGSPINLVFWSPVPVPNSKGNPFSGGVKYMWGGENLRFSAEISIYLRNSTR